MKVKVDHRHYIDVSENGRYYRDNVHPTFTVPLPVSGVMSVANGTAVQFSWTRPTTHSDLITFRISLKYGIHVTHLTLLLGVDSFIH